MMFQRINRDDPERMTMSVYNAASSAIPAGGSVIWDPIAGTTDGVRVTTPSTGFLGMVAGIAPRAIPQGSYGVIQVYGFLATAMVTSEAAQAASIGDPLVPVNGQFHLIRAGAPTSSPPIGMILMEAIPAGGPTVALRKVFIRLL